MKPKAVYSLFILLLASAWLVSAQQVSIHAAWNEKAAAAYLDGRTTWWMDWKTAARDHDTFCISCHTALPYALGRPALRAALGERAPSPNERKFLDNVIKRFRMWN